MDVVNVQISGWCSYNVYDIVSLVLLGPYSEPKLCFDYLQNWWVLIVFCFFFCKRIINLKEDFPAGELEEFWLKVLRKQSSFLTF